MWWRRRGALLHKGGDSRSAWTVAKAGPVRPTQAVKGDGSTEGRGGYMLQPMIALRSHQAHVVQPGDGGPSAQAQ